MADRDFLVKNGLVVGNGNLSITDKIVHSGDSDTAIRFPAANTVTVETNGFERLRVDSSGNIGIGKSPTTKLDVDGTVTATAFIGTFIGALDSADVAFIVDSNYTISRISNLSDTKLATISTAGKVSNSATTATNSNTANAIVARDSNGNFSAGVITSRAASGSGGGIINILPDSSTFTSELRLHTNSSGSTYHIVKNNSGTLTLGTLDSNAVSIITNNNERVFISPTGNIGIGKSPSTKLDVNGTVTATAFIGTFIGVLDSAQIKGLFSSGTGVSYNSGTGAISIGQAVGTGDTPTFNGLSASSAKITSLATPTVGTDAANKSYVDTIAAASLHYHDPVRVESPINLNATYDNGDSGVGATLTNAGTQAALVIDGVSVDSDDRVLVYQQTTQTQNGVYVVTHKGSPTSNWVLTRSSDTSSYAPSSPTSLGKGDAFYVKEGVTGAGELYVMTTAGTITFGTTNITFSQISSAQIYKAGYGIELSGTTFSVDSDRIVLSVNSLKGNITATNLLDAIITVDGAASGLDADLLDGQHGSYYRINVYNSSGTLLN